MKQVHDFKISEADAVIENLFSKANIPAEKTELITRSLSNISIKKGKPFIEYGKTCNKIGLLISGLLYASYPQENGGENVSRFFYAPENILVTSFDSFYNNAFSNESIIAIENSDLLVISKKDLFTLYKEIPEMNIVGRLLAEQSYIQALRRIHTLQAMTSQQRVNDFFYKQPGLFNRVQKKHLASYLGINRNAVTKYLNKKH